MVKIKIQSKDKTKTRSRPSVSANQKSKSRWTSQSRSQPRSGQDRTRIPNLKHKRSIATVSKNKDLAAYAARRHLRSKFGDRNFDRISLNFEQEFLSWNMAEVDTCDQTSSKFWSKFEQFWTRISNTAPVSKNRHSAPYTAGRHLRSKLGDRNCDRDSRNFAGEFLNWNMDWAPCLSAKTGIRPHT